MPPKAVAVIAAESDIFSAISEAVQERPNEERCERAAWELVGSGQSSAQLEVFRGESCDPCFPSFGTG